MSVCGVAFIIYPTQSPTPHLEPNASRFLSWSDVRSIGRPAPSSTVPRLRIVIVISSQLLSNIIVFVRVIAFIHAVRIGSHLHVRTQPSICWPIAAAIINCVRRLSDRETGVNMASEFARDGSQCSHQRATAQTSLPHDLCCTKRTDIHSLRSPRVLSDASLGSGSGS